MYQKMVQEVALAKIDPIVMFGPHESTWEWLVSTKKYEHQRALAEAALSFRHRTHGSDYLKDVTALIKILRRTTSTEPRDKVYALLSVASPSLRDLIKPDYKKPITDVFAEATYAIVKSSGAFDLLIYSRCHRGLQRYPSWMCDFDRTNITRFQDDADWQTRFALFQDGLKKVVRRRPLHTVVDVRHETALQALLVKGRMLDRIDDVSGYSLSDACSRSRHKAAEMSLSDKATLRSKDTTTSIAGPIDRNHHDVQQKFAGLLRTLRPGTSDPSSERGSRFSLWPLSKSSGSPKTVRKANKWDAAVTAAIVNNIDSWSSTVLADLGPNSPFQRIRSPTQDPYNSTRALQHFDAILQQTQHPLQEITAIFEHWRRRVSSRYNLHLPPRESEREDLEVWISYLECERLAFTRAGFPCLVPKTATPFDQLFLPNGGFAPMLLKSIPDQEAWEFGGFVYMNGIMDQELQVTGVADVLKEVEVMLV